MRFDLPGAVSNGGDAGATVAGQQGTPVLGLGLDLVGKREEKEAGHGAWSQGPP